MVRLQPPGWAAPRGYANGIAAEGRLVFVAGQIGWDETQAFRAHDLPGQVRQTLVNVRAVLAEAGAGPEHVARMTWYLVDRHDYLSHLGPIGAAYRDVMGRHFPAMAVVVVAGLLEPDAKIEIEATAVIPPKAAAASRPARSRP
jgi:enamine deaminase RidA (YjgF/YER057c/UK114 family)